jgi:hypothetical protein
MLNTKNLLLLVVVALVLLAGWYLWGPTGGRLTSLSESNFAEFTAQFDGAAGGERLLLPVSSQPSCAAARCQHASDAVLG